MQLDLYIILKLECYYKSFKQCDTYLNRTNFSQALLDPRQTLSYCDEDASLE